jgi:hypothetical protein
MSSQMKQLLLAACHCCLLTAAGLLHAFSAQAQVPIIASVAPASGPAGTSVTISGSGFAAAAAQNAVLFGTARATVTAASATQLTVQVPVGASSVAPVTVSNLSSQRLGSSLTSGTPFFTLTFAGGLNAASYQATSLPIATSRTSLGGLESAEFNGDNYADFAVVADGVLRLVLSDGSGGYQPAFQLAVGTSINSVKVADVDANGTSDILVSGISQLLLLRNLGGGNGFASAVALNLGIDPPGTQFIQTGLEVQDTNADGRPDIVLSVLTLGNSRTQLVELRNTGTGFAAPMVLTEEVVSGFVVADFTQDGRLDVLAAVRNNTGGGTRLLLLAGTAAGTYAAPVVFSLSTVSSVSNTILTNDLNADGLPDLVFGGIVTPATGSAGGGVVVALRTSTGFVVQGPFGERPSSSAASVLAVADFSGDSNADVASNSLTGAFSVLPGIGNGQLGAGISLGISPITVLTTGDFNNDGRTDVAGYDNGTGSLTIYRYTGASPNQNNPPTLNALPDLTLDEDAPQQTVALSGISNGGDAGQAVTLTAVSSDPSLVPNPSISYFSPTSTGTLRLQPAANAFGTCTITVTASDGQTQNGTLSRTFRVTVNPINDAPTLDPIPDVIITTLAAGQASAVVALSGITPGPANENQVLTFASAVSLAGGGLISNGNVTYTSPETTGQYILPVAPSNPGLYATVTLTVNDGQSANNTFSRTFRVFYQPASGPAANAPTLDPIADQTASRALATQVPVPLAGITDGDPNQVLPLTVSATSSDPSLVTPGTVSYTSPASTGSLPYTISSTRGGTATISVTVSNGQSTNGSITRSFRITVPQVLVTAAGQQPAATLEVYPNPTSGGGFWLKSPAAGPADVTVLDLSGRVVWQGRLASLQQPQRVPLAVAAGLYVVRVRTAAATLARRLAVE